MSNKNWAAFLANTRQLGSLTVSYENLSASGLVEDHLGLTVKQIIDAVGVRLEELEGFVSQYTYPGMTAGVKGSIDRERTIQARRLLGLNEETGEAKG